MDSGPTLKHKVTVKFNHLKTARPPSRSNVENIPSRPASPAKSYVTTTSAVDTPLFRPKAKVNSSATTRKVSAAKSPTLVTTNLSSRPGSPSKLTPRLRNGVTSPTTAHTPKAQSPALRSHPTVSATGLRNRSPTTVSNVSPSIKPPEDSRSRTGSVSSLHHAASFSSFPKPPGIASSVSERLGVVSAASSSRSGPASAIGVPDRTMSASPSLKIRSKVTATPSIPSGRSQAARARTASISSNLSQQLASQTAGSPPTHQFYPITTASPAANPHRFQASRPTPVRTSPPSVNQIFQSFSQQPTSKLRRDESPSPGVRIPQAKFTNIQVKVDPASIPLPPLSPPTSSISFSSRSSVSRSTASVVEGTRSGSQSSSTSSGRPSPASKQPLNRDSEHLKSTLDNLISYATSRSPADDDGASDSGQGDDDDHKVKATAKSNRKIADLEITNRSLLAINSTLEATRHRQAKEIRELKRKLRESRLILPPPAFRAVKSSLSPLEIVDDEEDIDDGDEDEDESDKDETYQRIKAIIDNLLESGQRALEETKDFSEGSKSAAKVLTAEEVRDWHNSADDFIVKREPGQRENLHDDNNPTYDSMHQYDTDDLDISIDQSNQSFTSEDEAESMTVFPNSTPSSPPPIFITKPT